MMSFSHFVTVLLFCYFIISNKLRRNFDNNGNTEWRADHFDGLD